MDQNNHFFALRHKPTQRYMPARMTATGKAGWSWWNPESVEFSGHGIEPRLFATIRGARTAARTWLKGRVSKEYDQQTGEFKTLALLPDEGRKAEDLEIVTLLLSEVRSEVAR
jgi:hypothetical protein